MRRGATNCGIAPIRERRGIRGTRASQWRWLWRLPQSSRSAQPQAAPVATIPVDRAAENREVVRAVKALNATEMFGQENQLPVPAGSRKPANGGPGGESKDGRGNFADPSRVLLRLAKN